MEDKQAAEILIKLMQKHQFSDDEKEALHAAVGILSWTSLAGSRLKNMKEKREKKLKNDLK